MTEPEEELKSPPIKDEQKDQEDKLTHLTIQRINKNMLESFYMSILKVANHKARMRMAESLGLIQYTLGWGIEENPPDEYGKREDIGLLGLRPNSLRAHWIMYIVLDGDQEVWATLSADVIQFTTGDSNGTPTKKWLIEQKN